MDAVESDRKCIDDGVIIVRWFMRVWHLGGYKYRDRYRRVVKFYSTLENGPLWTRPDGIDCWLVGFAVLGIFPFVKVQVLMGSVKTEWAISVMLVPKMNSSDTANKLNAIIQNWTWRAISDKCFLERARLWKFEIRRAGWQTWRFLYGWFYSKSYK